MIRPRFYLRIIADVGSIEIQAASRRIFCLAPVSGSHVGNVWKKVCTPPRVLIGVLFCSPRCVSDSLSHDVFCMGRYDVILPSQHPGVKEAFCVNIEQVTNWCCPIPRP